MIISIAKIKIGKVLKFSSYFDFLSIFIYCTINKIKSFFLGKREIMKSKLGMTLRKVRKGKQVSLSSVADEHLSKSQISVLNVVNRKYLVLDLSIF